MILRFLSGQFPVQELVFLQETADLKELRHHSCISLLSLSSLVLCSGMLSSFNFRTSIIEELHMEKRLFHIFTALVRSCSYFVILSICWRRVDELLAILQFFFTMDFPGACRIVDNCRRRVHFYFIVNFSRVPSASNFYHIFICNVFSSSFTSQQAATRVWGDQLQIRHSVHFGRLCRM